MSAIRAALLSATICLPAAAQTGPLIGFGADSAGQNPAFLEQALCNPAMVTCTNVLPAPVRTYSGGAAFDPRRRSLWHTEGTRLFEVGLDGCTRGCVTPAGLVLGPTSLVGGLTFDNAAEQLIHVESVAGMAAIVTYDFPPGQPCPVRLTQCRVPLPTGNHYAGAIALDNKRDQIWIAASDVGRTGPANRLLLVDRNDPNCSVRCLLGAQSCGSGPLGAIRAMAYDECDDRLYVSDGRQTTVFLVRHPSPTACPILVPETCCATNAPNGQLWAGFDRLPVEPRRIGGGCLPRRTCPSCATPPVLTTFGAPVVGNSDFQFRIEDAPTGTSAFVIFTPGPCSPQAFGCGTLFPALPTLVLGPVPVLGSGTCNGGARFPLPIPENHGLCDLLLCAQGILVCPAGGLGLTNGQVVPIGS